MHSDATLFERSPVAARPRPTASTLWLATVLMKWPGVDGNPKSRPFVAYRTNPFDQDAWKIMGNGVETSGIRKNAVKKRSEAARNEDDPRCPLLFRLGTTHISHFGGSSRKADSSSGGANVGAGTHTSPLIYPLHPDFDAGSGRQILSTSDYEALEMWTPSSAIGSVDEQHGRKGSFEGQTTEQMKEDEQFPLLFEASSFYHSSPIVHDIEGDGIADAILGDYDGNIHFVGLDFTGGDGELRRKRFYRRQSIPRLFVRKNWFDVAINRTRENEVMANTTAGKNHSKWEDFEPYHTHFAGAADDAWRRDEDHLRGVSDLLNMDAASAKGFVQRRSMKTSQVEIEDEANRHGEIDTNGGHRRLQEAESNDAVADDGNEKAQQGESGEKGSGVPVGERDETRPDSADDFRFDEDPGILIDDALDAPPDGTYDDAVPGVISAEGSSTEFAADDHPYPVDDYYGRYGYGDDYHGYRPEPPDGWDSYDEYQNAQDAYYHDSNYLRLPPHLLSTCTLAELPRAYAGSSAEAIDRIDEMLLCAVSYYFDEDECSAGRSFGRQANADGGDEDEGQRGRYVASAILGYNMRWKYWSTQEVLDLSTDWSAPLGDIVQGGTASVHSDSYNGMGAWAVASPTTAKLDGDKNHILLGTSMGLVYALEVQWHASKWVAQMRHPVERKIIVEDVVGDTNLEVFIVDGGGDVACLDANGKVLWARKLLRDEELNSLGGGRLMIVHGTSEMSLGAVDATDLAIVLLARIATTEHHHKGRPDKVTTLELRLYAIDAVTGSDLPHFPISYDSSQHHFSKSTLPQPLLIDLHKDQSYWLERGSQDFDAIRKLNAQASEEYTKESAPQPHGGTGRGLHIVQPVGSTINIIEGSTSCEQRLDLGDTIPSMVQADDIHGTGGVDLVVTTAQGEIITLESDSVPFHPLNTHSAGAARSPGSNSQSHGFSASQGIFVHPISRQYRDVLGVYLPVTFEIFDRRPNIDKEVDKQLYAVEIRAGMSAKRTVFSKTYNSVGVYTEKVQIQYGPGYYAFSVRLRSTHGIVYEDSFHLGWNVNYMGHMWIIVYLPLLLLAPLLLSKKTPSDWQDDDYNTDKRGGILGGWSR